MSAVRSRKTLLVLSQVYPPDPASVGQHMHDVAAEMARRGYRVRVLAADRGYDDPSLRYRRSEVIDGVEVLRLPLSSFGKSSIALRLAGGSAFVAQAFAAAMTLPRIDHVLVSTSPPMCAAAAVALGRLRAAPLTFWAMDINPDQIVATGALRPDAMPVRAFDALNRSVLRSAANVVALDKYMAERLRDKAPIGDRLEVIPPWPHVDVTEPVLHHEQNDFRAAHGLRDKFVVMYSGNLSPMHPVTTILHAAQRLRDDPRIVFLFVGGGLGRVEIERFAAEHALPNVRLLPYQPLEKLRESLSAADVHLVAMGDAMVGIVHPCKIYGAMAVARPVIVLGPSRCHLTDLVLGEKIGWHVAHGDVDASAELVRRLAALPAGSLDDMGQRARELVRSAYSRDELRARFCDRLEAPLI